MRRLPPLWARLRSARLARATSHEAERAQEQLMDEWKTGEIFDRGTGMLGAEDTGEGVWLDGSDDDDEGQTGER